MLWISFSETLFCSFAKALKKSNFVDGVTKLLSSQHMAPLSLISSRVTARNDLLVPI